MLISDWSSDVCSSDLVGIHAQRAALAAPIVETLRPDIADAQFAAEGRFDTIARVIEAEIAAAIEPFLIDEFAARMIERLGVDEGNRKSLVLGKRGSVRLDLGGSSNITKKKIKN